MDERRQTTRNRLKTSLDVIDTETGEKIGVLLDITPHGMKIKGGLTISVGKQIEMGFRLPKRIFGKNRLDIVAKCVWTHQDTSLQFQLCGFEFIEVFPEDANVILGLIMDQELVE